MEAGIEVYRKKRYRREPRLIQLNCCMRLFSIICISKPDTIV